VRCAGAGRFETATEISKAEFTTAKTVILAYGMNYADALAGVPLAKKLDAPILLTNTKSLDVSTADEIKRLKAEKVIILGGEGAGDGDALLQTLDAGVFPDDALELLGEDLLNQGGDVLIMVIERVAVDAAVVRDIFYRDLAQRPVVDQFQKGSTDRIPCEIRHGTAPFSRISPIIPKKT
jgi:hypothetical protein